MKNYQFIALNILGIFFAFYALAALICVIFHLDILVPHALQGFYIFSVMGTIILMPIISFVIIKFGNNRKISKLLGFTYLSFWLIVLVILVIQFN
jgi:hypothetical protein